MMRRSYVWFVGAVAVLLLDGIGAVASRYFGFPYASLSSISYILYFCIGVGGGRLGGARAGSVAGGITALVDATLGRGISSLVGVGEPLMGRTTLAVALVILMAVCIGGVLGALGGFLGYIVRRSLQADV